MSPFGVSRRYLEVAADILHQAEVVRDPELKVWLTGMADIAARAAVAETVNPDIPTRPGCGCIRCIRYLAGVRA